MKGIILKDFYENYIIRKNLANWIFGFVMLIAVIAVFRTKYIFALACGLILPLLGTSMLQFSMEQDDIAHFYKLERTYPLTIRQVVLAKYILGLLSIGFFLLISFALSFLYVYGYRVATFREGLQIWAAGIPIGLTFLAITYLGFFLFGARKGIILYVVVTAVSALTFAISYFSIGVLKLLAIHRTLLLIASYPLSIALVVGSYLLSVRCYKKRIK